MNSNGASKTPSNQSGSGINQVYDLAAKLLEKIKDPKSADGNINKAINELRKETIQNLNYGNTIAK